MRITPLDIYQKEFRRVLRGIDADEVEEFLETVADDYEKLIKENKDLKEQMESLKSGPNAAGQISQADRSDAAAREEAVNLIRDAKR